MTRIFQRGQLLTEPRLWLRADPHGAHSVSAHCGDLVTRADVPGVLWEVTGNDGDLLMLRRFARLGGQGGSRRSKNVRVPAKKLRYMDAAGLRALNAVLGTDHWAPSWLPGRAPHGRAA